MPDNSVQRAYGNRIRMRACGLCRQGNKILLVNHRGLYPHDFWAPPGGGIEFGETARACLEREFREETGLEIRAGDFLFACEFIRAPLHAIELFFVTEVTGGNLETGKDPEMAEEKQIIREVKYMTYLQILALPEIQRHGLFKVAKSPEKLHDLRGYLTI